MLPHSEIVEADAIRKHDRLEQVANRLGTGAQRAIRITLGVAKTVNADFHGLPSTYRLRDDTPASRSCMLLCADQL